MVNREQKMNDQVEETMRSLDGIERAWADALFYERLKEKLEKREQKRTLWFAAAAAVIGFLVLFNVFTVLQYQQGYGETDIATQQSEDPLELIWEYQAEPMLAEYDLIENYELTGRD